MSPRGVKRETIKTSDSEGLIRIRLKSAAYKFLHNTFLAFFYLAPNLCGGSEFKGSESILDLDLIFAYLKYSICTERRELQSLT